jgi:hypothetical protein
LTNEGHVSISALDLIKHAAESNTQPFNCDLINKKYEKFTGSLKIQVEFKEEFSHDEQEQNGYD